MINDILAFIGFLFIYWLIGFLNILYINWLRDVKKVDLDVYIYTPIFAPFIIILSIYFTILTPIEYFSDIKSRITKLEKKRSN